MELTSRNVSFIVWLYNQTMGIRKDMTRPSNQAARRAERVWAAARTVEIAGQTLRRIADGLLTSQPTRREGR